MRARFFLSWWAYSFPLAAITVASLEMAARLNAPVLQGIAVVLLAAVTLAVAGLVVRTLQDGVPFAGMSLGKFLAALGGAQDMGYFRRLLDDGIIPTSEDFEAAGFFAEHHTPLPEPDCGERVCVQAMLGVMGNLINGNNCTMLQIGLNSPIVADPGSRPPLNLSVVVDVSGSMRDAGKIDFVRQGLEQLIDALHDDDQVALITYSSDATVLFEMAALRDGRNQLRSLVRRIDAGGATNLFEGLESGFRQSLGAYDSGRQNRLILLSDGNPTAGITNTDAIMAMSRAFNSEGVGITSVGLGTDFNYELMRGLAEQGDGNYYFVEDAAAVDEVFSQEISYFTVPVAFDLELELSAGSDYRFVRAHGSSFWEDTADGGRLSVPSVFLAHRVSHDDVEPGGGRRGGGSALLIELMPDVTPDGREPGEARVAEITARFRSPVSSRSGKAVMKITGRSPRLASSSLTASTPDEPSASWMSARMRSGRRSPASSIAAEWVRATPVTSWPMACTMPLRSMAMIVSSSMIITLPRIARPISFRAICTSSSASSCPSCMIAAIWS